MYVIDDRIVSFLSPESIEPQAREQLNNISEMPFVFHYVAVMPDCHLGKGGVERAAETLHGIRSAWVKEQEIQIENGKISAYKVIIKITFVLDKS